MCVKGTIVELLDSLPVVLRWMDIAAEELDLILDVNIDMPITSICEQVFNICGFCLGVVGANSIVLVKHIVAVVAVVVFVVFVIFC